MPMSVSLNTPRQHSCGCVLESLYKDAYTVGIDDVVELWELADVYQLEGLKWTCMGSLERGLCDENVSRILQETDELD